MPLILNDEMAATKRKMPPNFFKCTEDNKENLKSCGILLILHVMKEYKNHNYLKIHVNEILHSVFFFGVIYKSGLTPDNFLSESVSEGLRTEFPEPFEKYKNHLPKRTPFSVLLNMMKLKYETKEKVMEELRILLKKLKFPQPLDKPGNKNQHLHTLESTVICVCYNSLSLSNTYHFGASLGCKTQEAKNIMIYSSCINTWHEYVSYAVMSFTHNENDGLTIPESVNCQAYLRNWKENTYEEIPPCGNCTRIFSLPGKETKKEFYPYGNCAETECLSNLLFHDKSMHERQMINDTNYTKNNKRLINQTKIKLKKMLDSIPSISGMFNSDSLPIFNSVENKRCS